MPTVTILYQIDLAFLVISCINHTFSLYDYLNGILRIRTQVQRVHSPVSLPKLQWKLSSLQ